MFEVIWKFSLGFILVMVDCLLFAGFVFMIYDNYKERKDFKKYDDKRRN